MNRRQFFRSGAAFTSLLIAAPKLALSLPLQTRANPISFQPVLDYSKGCPSYETILADLIAGFKEVYGDNAHFGLDSMNHQWLSIMARQQCDTLCTIHKMYDSLSVRTAHGAQLDSISRMCYTVRKPGESDHDLRERMMDLIGQTEISPLIT